MAVKRVMQRYLIASGGFAVAAVSFGLGLVSAFECLLVFALTSLIVELVQRRQIVAGRGTARRSDVGRSHGRRPRAVESRNQGRSSARLSTVLNSDADGDELPSVADYGW